LPEALRPVTDPVKCVGPRDTLKGSGDTSRKGRESTDEFEELKSAMVTDLAPVGALEELLVDQFITFSWRWRG